ELHQRGGLGVVPLQLVQRLVDRQQLVHAVVGDQEALVQLPPPRPAAALDPVLASCPLDQDAAHGLGGGGEEVPATVPVLDLVHVHQPQVGFVHQGGGLKRLAGRLLGQS